MLEASLRSLVESIYEAAVEPDRWQAVLAQLVPLLGGQQAALGFADTTSARSTYHVEHGMDPEYLRTWVEEFGAFDCWAEGARRRGVRPGRVVTGAELVDPEEFFASDVWRGCFSRYGVDDSLALVVGGSPDHLGYLAVFRSLDRGLFGTAERRLAAPLLPHLAIAASTHAELATAWRQGQLDLAASPFGVALLDARGHVRAWNDEARRIADTRDGLAFMRAKLVALDARAQARLEDAIARASLAPEAGGEGSVLRIARRSGASPYRLSVLPVPRRSGERFFAWTVRPPTAFVIVADPDAAASADADARQRLRELLSLTSAADEADLRHALREPTFRTAGPRR